MAKKTLKEKLQTETRKQKIVESALYTFTASSSATSPKQHEQLTAYTIIKKDIVKTVIMSVFFIGIEIVLFSVSKKYGW